MTAMAVDFAHTGHAEGRRRTTAIHLARYLGALSRLTCCHFGSNSVAGVRGRWAFIRRDRAETWYGAARLLEQKTRWTQAHPEHPAAARARLDE